MRKFVYIRSELPDVSLDLIIMKYRSLRKSTGNTYDSVKITMTATRIKMDVSTVPRCIEMVEFTRKKLKNVEIKTTS